MINRNTTISFCVNYSDKSTGNYAGEFVEGIWPSNKHDEWSNDNNLFCSFVVKTFRENLKKYKYAWLELAFYHPESSISIRVFFRNDTENIYYLWPLTKNVVIHYPTSGSEQMYIYLRIK